MPYERVVQWAAGPTSALAGWLATQLVTNVNLFGSLGVGRDQLAHAILAALTFGVTAVLTYAAHHKWLSNLAKWWDVSGLPAPSGVLPAAPFAIGGLNGNGTAASPIGQAQSPGGAGSPGVG